MKTDLNNQYYYNREILLQMSKILVSFNNTILYPLNVYKCVRL